MDDELKVQFYSLGGRPSNQGAWMLALDVLKALELMLDDDEQTVTRLIEYRDSIKALVPR
jgi:hypothetical protein